MKQLKCDHRKLNLNTDNRIYWSEWSFCEAATGAHVNRRFPCFTCCYHVGVVTVCTLRKSEVPLRFWSDGEEWLDLSMYSCFKTVGHFRHICVTKPALDMTCGWKWWPSLTHVHFWSLLQKCLKRFGWNVDVYMTCEWMGRMRHNGQAEHHITRKKYKWKVNKALLKTWQETSWWIQTKTKWRRSLPARVL